MRPAIAHLSTDNLLHNANLLKKLVKPAKIIAMLKANAYGHGIRSVGMRLQNVVDALGVASIDEALILRSVKVNIPIILMQGVYEVPEFVIASENAFEVVIHDFAQLDLLNEIHLQNKIKIWLKISTGMNRLGFNIEDSVEVYENLNKCRNVKHPVNIMSHLACASEKNHHLNYKQLRAFEDFIKYGKPDTEYSLCNSAGILNFPNDVYDYARPGLLLYGASPINHTVAKDYGFKPVMQMCTKIMSVQLRKKGEYIGYDALYKCEENMPIGMIAFGYGDGYPNSKYGKVFIRDNFARILGKISMDMIAIDLRNVPNVKFGEEVILWGNELPIEHLSESTGVSIWNIFTGVQNRVRFKWD